MTHLRHDCPALYVCLFKWGIRVRVYGYCMVISRDWPRLFSERTGMQKVIRLGRWSMRFPARRM